MELNEEYSGITEALAELVVEAPPDWLRSSVFANALTRRRAKQPLRATQPTGPVAGFIATIDQFRNLLKGLDPRDWVRPLLSVGPGADTVDGWTIKDLVSHLIAIESYFGAAIGLAPWVAPEGTEADHRAMTMATIAEMHGHSYEVVFRTWNERVEALRARLEVLTVGELSQRTRLHSLHLPLHQILTIRTFEVWTHVEDVARTIGLPPPGLDEGRLPAMTAFAVGLVPFGLALNQLPHSGKTARIVLTGIGGGAFDQALAWGEHAGEPDVVLIADAVDFCRLAAKRLFPCELRHQGEGEVGLVADILVGCAVLAA